MTSDVRDDPLRDVGDDHVATITLNRPEVLNAFDRQMCEEMRDAWRQVKDDPSVNAVVLRAAGDRAFCAGLDTKKPYGQPDDVWNHEDPGELLSPKWQKVWKPVVCAVQGICTAGAFYFLNEADIVICSRRRDVLRLARDLRAWSRRSSRSASCAGSASAETLRIALSGNDERVTADDRAAHRPGHRGRRRATSSGPRAHEIAAGIAAQADAPRRRARCARSGSRSTGRTAPRWSRASSTRASATRSARPRWPSRAPTGPKPRLR